MIVFIRLMPSLLVLFLFKLGMPEVEDGIFYKRVSHETILARDVVMAG